MQCGYEGILMRVLIIFAHAEPTSFNGSMLRAGIAALTAAGHEVEVSDLYAMGFDPVSDRRNFVTIANPDELRQQAEEVSIGVQSGPPIGVQKGPPCSCGDWLMLGACFALLAA